LKSSMSWLDIKVWIEECRPRLVGSYIDNVYLLDNIIVLRLRTSKGIETLVLEPSKRINITSSDIRRLAKPTSRQSLWRSLLRECRIIGIRQLGLERVIELHLRCGSEERRLVLELLPRGVALVTDLEGKILVSTESRRMRDRVIAPGKIYRPPPTNKPFTEMSLEELVEALKKGRDLVRGLIRGWGIPPEVAETVLRRLGIELSTPTDSVSSELVDRVRNEIARFINEVVARPQPCITYSGGELEGFYPFIPVGRGDRVEIVESFNDAVDRFFTELAKKAIAQSRVKALEEERKRIERAIEGVKRTIDKYCRELNELRRVLEVLEKRYSDLERVHDCVRRVVKEIGWSGIEKCGAAEVDRSRGLYRVTLDGIPVDLDVRKNLVEIYNELRKRVSKLEKDVEHARRELENLRHRLEEVLEERSIEERAVEMRLSKKSEWFERYHWLKTSSGLLAIGGRDASQNISILRKFVSPHDVVLHADVHGASAVVLKVPPGKEPSEQDIREAAALAACYSKAWKHGLRCVDVFWVRGDQVSLSPPSGEYLPRGGFMVYGKKNFVKCVELRLALGIELDGQSYRVIVGPEHLVASRAVAYMVLEPGNDDPATIVKRFREALKSGGLRVLARCLDPNELLSRIPGKSKIVKLVIKRVGNEAESVDNS